MKVIVGMSGGVDSSVAAYLLLQAGYQVSGLFMKNWEEDDESGYCSATQDLADAQAVCAKLNIELHSVNFAAEYWDQVFALFLNEYKNGRTPNPDILCNKEIKFKAFLDYAYSLGADYIATGHYVRSKVVNNKTILLKGKDRNKDQSYFLHAIAPLALGKSLFPIGDYTKDQVRAIAHELGFVNHNKKDSTGICFIGERKFKNFLKEYLLTTPGNIRSCSGQILGRHEGTMFFTIGQRKGLAIGGISNASEEPWYVVDKNLQTNEVIIAQGDDHPLLYAQGLICGKIHWLEGQPPSMPFECTAKIRYRQEDQACLITSISNEQNCVMFCNKQRAVTPGQSVVFYNKNQCLGGAVIEELIR